MYEIKKDLKELPTRTYQLIIFSIEERIKNLVNQVNEIKNDLGNNDKINKK